MLTEEMVRHIREEVQLHEQKRGACIEALRVVQQECGWVDDENVCEIAALLEMTPDEVDGVATFFNLIFRRPVGRHVILVCNSVCCWTMGYEKVLDVLLARLGIELGETTPDGRFTLLPVVCLGACDLAPAIQIDADLHGNMDTRGIEPILAQYE